MEVTSTNSHPVGYHRRRNSYITAIEKNNTFILEPFEITRRCSAEVNWNNHKKKLTSNISHESGSSSQCSSCIRKKRNSTTSNPSSTSRMSSMQEIERHNDSLPLEFTSSLLQCQVLTKNSEVQCKCRRDSLLSIKGSSTTVSASRHHDSGYSLSTCQSLIIPSSVRNSANQITLTNERRHSDVTHSRRNNNNNEQRRLSDQSVVKSYHCNDTQMSSLSTTISLPCSLLPKDNTKCTKLLDRRNATSFKHMRNFTRQNSDGSIESFHRDSFTPMTNKMMKRRFSEQLILEGGLTCEPEFEELVEADDLEESLTGIIARKKLTLKSHYYPEGHWGYIITIVAVIIQLICHGLQVASGVLLSSCARQFNTSIIDTGWLGAMSTGVALLVSPVTIAFCRRKSTRVTAVLGGLVTALGCLFTSFASQFHQLFFSYGAVVGIGVGITRDCSTLMVAQYFKRRREFVEIFIVSGSGLGIAVMSAFIKGAIGKIGWRLGLQAVTGVVFLTFILGTFYRSASLYHPQRRAILHLKNQKRKIKDKNKVDDKPPFFDFSTLKSKTVKILLVSTSISAFGISTPIFYLAHQIEEEGLGDNVVLLQAYLGLAWTVGCITFGVLVVHHSVECRIARQYLTQTAVFMCGICILALTAVNGNYHGYVMFTWIYGIFCGGYHYSLKMYTYERVRARNFARTWGFVQCSQAIPIAIGVPISGYINVGCGGKAGYYFSSTCVLVGSFTLFFIDLHKRNLSKHKHTKSNGTKHICNSDSCSQRRRLSFSQDAENDGGAAGGGGGAATGTVLGSEHASASGEIIDKMDVDKPELTCISEEGIADMDLPDNILDDIDYIGDCITSCNKVENYLMLSEFENNLIAEMPINMDRKGRRWSLIKSRGHHGNQCSHGNGKTIIEEDESPNSKWHLNSAPMNDRAITVIDEASTSNVEYR